MACPVVSGLATVASVVTPGPLDEMPDKDVGKTCIANGRSIGSVPLFLRNKAAEKSRRFGAAAEASSVPGNFQSSVAWDGRVSRSACGKRGPLPLIENGIADL